MRSAQGGGGWHPRHPPRPAPGPRPTLHARPPAPIPPTTPRSPQLPGRDEQKRPVAETGAGAGADAADEKKQEPGLGTPVELIPAAAATVCVRAQGHEQAGARTGYGATRGAPWGRWDAREAAGRETGPGGRTCLGFQASAAAPAHVTRGRRVTVVTTNPIP
jgi:hypothetical protein